MVRVQLVNPRDSEIREHYKIPWVKICGYVESILTIAANAHKDLSQLIRNPLTFWQVFYVLPFKLRWRYRFFRFPYEVKILSFIRTWLLLIKKRFFSSWKWREDNA